MGQLVGRKIVQTRVYLEPDPSPVPDLDYEYQYPISVYEAIRKTTDDDAPTLDMELESIYRLINGKQDTIGAGTPGRIMTWTGISGQIGELTPVDVVNPTVSERSSKNIPTERAVGAALDLKVSYSQFNDHVSDGSIHMTDIERTKWNAMAPLSSLNAHINNTTMHTTDEERSRWNGKADQTVVENHIYNTENPHNVTVHQAGGYTRREIDDMIAAIRESYFNYKNIYWDSRYNQATLQDYSDINWNPNFVLGYSDDLPDIDNPESTYFALRPATDYKEDESQDCIIYVKLPGMVWQEVGVQNMTPGDMVITYPDTEMYAWVSGRFQNLFNPTGADGEVIATSTLLWRPFMNDENKLDFTMSNDTTTPGPFDIHGKDGYTPIKGIDYTDGKDGEGVPAGGVRRDILVKLTDDNYDTTWQSLIELLRDLVLAGESLPDGLVEWSHIKDRPQWYNEFGPNDDGFITQKAVSERFDSLDITVQGLREIINGIGADEDGNGGTGGFEDVKQTLFDHINDYNNPHRVTADQIGAVSNGIFAEHVQNFSNPHNVTPTLIGLGNVDNTSDMDKPVSTATQEAIDAIIARINLITGGTENIDYVTNITYESSSTTINFTFNDGKTLDVELPIVEIFTNIDYDNTQKELVITLPDGSEKRVDIHGMVQNYFGSIGPHIQVTIEDDGVIHATLLPDSVGEFEIAASVHLRGSPTVVTPPVSDNSQRIASTEFVKNQVIDNLISYDTSRPLSANQGRILNQMKANVDEIIDLINDMEDISVVDNLDSTSPESALSANMGRYLDLTKAPRVHTSTSGSTYGRATIDLFGHARASDIDPLMDGSVFRGTDDGYYARADHRHPTDITRAPIHWPDVTHGQYQLTGEPRSTLAPDDDNSNWIATTEWVRRNSVGVSAGECKTAGGIASKVATLKSTYMENPVLIRQIGSTVAITFEYDDTVDGPLTLDVHGTGPAPVLYGGEPTIVSMIKGGYTYLFTFYNDAWNLINPTGSRKLEDSDFSNSLVSSEWVRRNAVGVAKGECTSGGSATTKMVTLQSTYMADPVFIRQIGSTVSVRFANQDEVDGAKMNVHGTGAAPIMFAGEPIIAGMLKAEHYHMFTFDGTNWQLINPAKLIDYGVCTTGAATAAKTVECDGYKLFTGSEITVKFVNGNTANNLTLNVNGTGAKPIYYRGSYMPGRDIDVDRTYTFRYNGNQYDFVGDSLAKITQADTANSETLQTSKGFVGKFMMIDTVNVDDTGRVTGVNKHTVNIPSWTLTPTTSAEDIPLPNNTITVLDSVTADDYGRLIGVNTKTIKNPAWSRTNGNDAGETLPTANGADGKFEFVNSITTDAYGRVTGVNKKTITIPKFTRTDTTGTAVDASSKTTFDVVDSITTDSYGRVTAVNKKSVTINSGIAIQSSQPDASKYRLWIDTSSSGQNILMFSNGSTWTNVRAVWG